MLSIEKIQDRYSQYIAYSQAAAAVELQKELAAYQKKCQKYFESGIKGLSAGELSQILYLDLSYGRFKPENPKHKLLAQLKALDLSHNSIRDFEFLKEMPHLEILVLSHCKLKQIPEEIAFLPKLKILDISQNQIANLSERIAKLHKLVILNARGNDMRRLPAKFIQLNQLIAADLSNNRISNFPKNIKLLEHLQYLDFSKNNLNLLPPEIGKLQELRHLDLMLNKLEALPEEIKMLSELRFLNLDRNRLSALPRGLSSLSKLRVISYSYNPFGKMPQIKRHGIGKIAPALSGVEEKNYDYVTIRVAKPLKKPIAEYLSFFAEYMALSKNQRPLFEIREVRNGLLLIMDKTDPETTEKLEEYFYEYVNLARRTGEKLSGEAENGKQTGNYPDLNRKLDTEIQTLQKTIQQVKLENYRLADQSLFLRELSLCLLKRDIYPNNEKINLFDSPKLYNHKTIGKENRPQFFAYLKTLIAKNEIQKLLQVLIEFYKDTEDTQSQNFVIMQSSAYSDLAYRHSCNLISNGEYKIELARINHALLNFIDKQNTNT